MSDLPGLLLTVFYAGLFAGFFALKREAFERRVAKNDLPYSSSENLKERL